MSVTIDEYFLIEPDWKKSVSFRKKWRTSIQTAITGGEKKSALFGWPRRSLLYAASALSPAEANHIKRKLFKNLHNIWGVPYWQDRTVLTARAFTGQNILNVGSTVNRNFEMGASCVLLESRDSYEAHPIDAIADTSIILRENLTSTWPAGTEVYPLLKARLKATQKMRTITSAIGDIQIEAAEAYDDGILRAAGDIAGFPVFREIPVFDIEPNWINPIDQEFLHPCELLAFYGKEYSESNYTETDLRLRAQYLFDSKSEIQAYFAFFDEMMGRWGAFWVPSWQDDIVVTAAFEANATTFIIENIEYADYWLDNDVTGRYLFFLFPDGTQAYRKIMTAPSGTSITLGSEIGKACSAGELGALLVSFLYLVRFDQDEAEIKYDTEDVGTAEISFKTQGRDPVPTTTTTTTSSSTTTS